MVKPKAITSEECLGAIDVKSWCKQICDYATTVEYSPMITNMKALELRWMKQINMKSEHEYFIAMILHADGTTRYICIKQFGENYIPPNTSQRSLQSLDSLKEHLAKDQVSMVGGWPRGDKLLEKVNVKNINVTLLDLAIAAWIVNTDCDQYTLLKGQCIWYSDMVMRIKESSSPAGKEAWLEE
ncbi:hypothetical protein BU17DRAFT_61930 [Hysterangium stoloniferum]|nr:hypothetical protein BU17DRAFT_61930 [Hysterangium stoloniferum]